MIALIALLDAQRRVLLLKRPPEVHCGGFWSLPGGKQREGETPLACARRELLEETGICGRNWRQCHEWRYRYPDRTLYFTLFLAECEDDPPLCSESPFRWQPIATLRGEEMPPANREILPLQRWLQ